MFKFVCSVLFLVLITGCSGTATNLPAGYTLPAMPDETLNSATLVGIDANTNGVRDDVEIFIYTNYSKPEEQKVQMQMAKNIQERFYNVKSKADGHIWFEKMGNAQDCQEKVFGTIEDGLKESKILYSKTLNTMNRVEADLRIRLLMSGEVFPLIQNENPCE
jgi:hypothetical protein